MKEFVKVFWRVVVEGCHACAGSTSWYWLNTFFWSSWPMNNVHFHNFFVYTIIFHIIRMIQWDRQINRNSNDEQDLEPPRSMDTAIGIFVVTSPNTAVYDPYRLTWADKHKVERSFIYNQNEDIHVVKSNWRLYLIQSELSDLLDPSSVIHLIAVWVPNSANK